MFHHLYKMDCIHLTLGTSSVSDHLYEKRSDTRLCWPASTLSCI